MEKEFKEIIDDSKKSLEKIEKNIEEMSHGLKEEADEFWIELKSRLSNIETKLDDTMDNVEDQIELKGHLGMMEARERFEKLKELADEFAHIVSVNVQEDIDVAALRAHLLKMEGEDLWHEKQKELSLLYENSKDEVEKLTIKAAKELNHIFLKLTEIV